METIAFAALAFCVAGTGAVLATVSDLPRAVLDRAQTAGRYVSDFGGAESVARGDAQVFADAANDQRRRAA